MTSKLEAFSSKHNFIKILSGVVFVLLTEFCFTLFVCYLANNEYKAIRNECLFKENFDDYFLKSLSSDVSRSRLLELLHQVNKRSQLRIKRTPVLVQVFPLNTTEANGVESAGSQSKLKAEIIGFNGNEGFPRLEGSNGYAVYYNLNKFDDKFAETAEKGLQGNSVEQVISSVKGESVSERKQILLARQWKNRAKGNNSTKGDNGQKGDPGRLLQLEVGSSNDNGEEDVFGLEEYSAEKSSKGDSAQQRIPAPRRNPGSDGKLSSLGMLGEKGVKNYNYYKFELRNLPGLKAVKTYKGDSWIKAISGLKDKLGLDGKECEQKFPTLQRQFNGCQIHFAHEGNQYAKFYIIGRNNSQENFNFRFVTVGTHAGKIMLSESNNMTAIQSTYQIYFDDDVNYISVCANWTDSCTELERRYWNLGPAESVVRSYQIMLYGDGRNEMYLNENHILSWQNTDLTNIKYLSFSSNVEGHILYVYNCEEKNIIDL